MPVFDIGFVCHPRGLSAIALAKEEGGDPELAWQGL